MTRTYIQSRVKVLIKFKGDIMIYPDKCNRAAFVLGSCRHEIFQDISPVECQNPLCFLLVPTSRENKLISRPHEASVKSTQIELYTVHKDRQVCTSYFITCDQSRN